MMKGEGFGVWCASDGVMGHREAWLKSDGVQVRFETRDEAERKAAELNAGVSPFACIYYSARAAL